MTNPTSSRRTRITAAAVALALALAMAAAAVTGLLRTSVAQSGAAIRLDAPVSFPVDI